MTPHKARAASDPKTRHLVPFNSRRNYSGDQTAHHCEIEKFEPFKTCNFKSMSKARRCSDRKVAKCYRSAQKAEFPLAKVTDKCAKT